MPCPGRFPRRRQQGSATTSLAALTHAARPLPPCNLPSPQLPYPALVSCKSRAVTRRGESSNGNRARLPASRAPRRAGQSSAVPPSSGLGSSLLPFPGSYSAGCGAFGSARPYFREEPTVLARASAPLSPRPFPRWMPPARLLARNVALGGEEFTPGRASLPLNRKVGPSSSSPLFEGCSVVRPSLGFAMRTVSMCT